MVLEFEWIDHHSPPLKLLFIICEKIQKFLEKDKENVVVVNCRAGKGRTGTIICCYLLFCGRFKNPDDVFLYYSRKRFRKGEGVTQPSQKKYVRYFYQMLVGNYEFPYVRCITGIQIKKFSRSSYNNKYITPYFGFFLRNSAQESYSTKTNYFLQKKFLVTDDSVFITEDNFSYTIAGDITIKIYMNGLLSTKQLGRISFNTAFLEREQTEIKFKLNEIDPIGLLKNKKVPKDYEINVLFKKMICDCQNTGDRKICQNCLDFLTKNNEIKDWEEIRNILQLHIPYEEKNEECKNRGNKLLFGKNELDDVDSVLNMQDNENNNEENENDDSSDSDKSDNEENEFDDSFEGECFLY